MTPEQLAAFIAVLPDSTSSVEISRDTFEPGPLKVKLTFAGPIREPKPAPVPDFGRLPVGPLPVIEQKDVELVVPPELSEAFPAIADLLRERKGG